MANKFKERFIESVKKHKVFLTVLALVLLTLGIASYLYTRKLINDIPNDFLILAYNTLVGSIINS